MKATTITALMLVFIASFFFAGLATALPADEVHERIAGIQAKIDTAIKEGLVAPAIARDLNFKLDSVRRRLKIARGTPAMAVEYQEMMKRLNIIDAGIPKAPPPREQPPEAKIESRIGALKTAIEEGRASGTIVAIEARALHTELNSIRKDFEAASKRLPLSQPEIVRLNSKLNRLSARIEKYKANYIHR